MKIRLLIIYTLLTLSACGQNIITSTPMTMDKLEAFKQKEKFGEDMSIFYPGINDTSMLNELTEKINKAADDFELLASKKDATEKDYQDKIDTGLKRFSSNYMKLDTEDRELICTYFEELMDIVGLESSGGHLNDFMYGSTYSK